MLSIMEAGHSQESTNEFSIPPPADSFENYSRNPIYQRGSNLTLRWLTDFEIYSLQFQQDLVNGSGNAYTLEDDLTIDDKTYCWNVDSKVFNLSLPAIYHVRLVNEVDDGQVIESHFFNISIPKPASTAVTPSATLTTTLTSSTSYSNPTVLPNNEAPAGGLSTGSAIGVGLGCGTFLVLIALLCICINRKRRNSRKRPVIGVGPDDYDDDGNYIGPLVTPSRINSGQFRDNRGIDLGMSPMLHVRTAPSVPTTYSIKRKPLPGTVSGYYDHRRNYSRPLEVTNPTVIPHKDDGPITPLSASSHVEQGMGRYIPSPSKGVSFSERLGAARYQIPLPGIESDFGEDINRRLDGISSPLSDPAFIADLERRLSGTSQCSNVYGSNHGSIYDVSPASCE